VHPAGPGEAAALAAAPTARTVVWLDELQRYLDGEHGLDGSVIRALLSAPHPSVVIATIWPGLHADYTAAPAPGGPDLHGREREVLGPATVIRVGADFSRAEQERARDAAGRDRRRVRPRGRGWTGLPVAHRQVQEGNSTRVQHVPVRRRRQARRRHHAELLPQLPVPGRPRCPRPGSPGAGRRGVASRPVLRERGRRPIDQAATTWTKCPG
jgi:hypothetical protein